MGMRKINEILAEVHERIGLIAPRSPKTRMGVFHKIDPQIRQSVQERVVKSLDHVRA